MATDGFGIAISGATIGAFAEIIDLVPPGFEIEDINVTTHGSTGGWAEYLASSIIETGETAMSLLFDKAQLALIYTNKGVAQEYTITDSDGNTWVSTGYIRALANDAVPINDAIRQTVTIKWTGESVFTPAA
jgi:hypothetical protein